MRSFTRGFNCADEFPDDGLETETLLKSNEIDQVFDEKQTDDTEIQEQVFQ
jgi:hypothetical protein